MDYAENLAKHADIAAAEYGDNLTLRRALEAFAQSHGHDFEIAYEIGVLRERHARVMVGRCKHCQQIAVARINPWPRPLLFGRWKWKPIEVVASEYDCSYVQRQHWGIDNKGGSPRLEFGGDYEDRDALVDEVEGA